jgi:hypothetical protein
VLNLRRRDRALHVPDDLVHLGPSPAPIASIYLGRTDVERMGDAAPAIARELRQSDQLALPQGRSRKSFEADVDGVRTYLERSPDDARGLAIFSCTALRLWRVLAFATPLPSLVHVGLHPLLLPLVEATQDAAPVLVALGDTSALRLIALDHPRPRALPTRRDRTRPRLPGMSSGRRPPTELPWALEPGLGDPAHEAAAATARAARTHRIGRLAIVGEESWRLAVIDALAPAWRARVRAEASLDVHAALDEVAERVWAAVQAQAAHERRQAVTAIAGRVDERQRAVSGAARVSECLSAGRVETLVIDAATVEPARSEVFVRHALAHRSRVVVVRDEPQLGHLGGLVATLG